MTSKQTYIREYRNDDSMPKFVRDQIRSMLDMEWSDPEPSANARHLVEPWFHPVYFALHADKTVYSYCRTISTHIDYAGLRLKIYGLGDLVTLPGCRRNGYASRLIEAATMHIRLDHEADIALLQTRPELLSLYSACGWKPLPEIRISSDDIDNDEAPCTMGLLLSSHSKTLFHPASEHILSLPGDEW